MADKRKQFMSTRRFIIWGGILLLVCVGGIALYRGFQRGTLTPGDANTIPINANGSQASSGNNNGQVEQYSVGVELSPGQAQLQPVQISPLATGEPLSPEEITLIFSRLPDLLLAPGDQTVFNLPQEALPPPRPGNTIKDVFPPLETGPAPGTVDAGPLQVLRFAPDPEGTHLLVQVRALEPERGSRA